MTSLYSSTPIGRFLRLSFLFLGTFAFLVSNVGAKPEKDTDGDPAQPFIENLPASKHLLKAPKPTSVQIVPKQIKATQLSPPSAWGFRGPAPIPNGQTNGVSLSVNGRVASIAIDPTDANIAYVGAASGGLYRTTDGGTSWVQLMDSASTPSAGIALSIGSVTIDPTDRTRLFVGTGEGNLSSDSFFGSGFYIITGANGGSPVVSGPFNAASGSDPAGGVPAGTDIFTGRSIVAIAVDPRDANTVYVSTSSGVGGIRSTTYTVLPRRGIYRTQNALAATPAWTRLQVGGTSTNTISSSLLLDPQNPDNLIVAMVGQAGTDPSGIYRSVNPTVATPTFTLSQTLPANTSVNANSKLAAGHSASVNSGITVVYATSGENAPTASVQGKLYKSIDAGATFTNIPAVSGFAGGQAFYDIAVGTDPNNPNTVAVGGQAGFRVFERSIDGGTNWTIDPNGGPYTIAAGLHADVHAIAFAPTNGSVVYHGNDGGIFRSTDGGNNWSSINGGGFSAVQYMGIALHPSNADFTLSGSQDNGTEFLQPGGTINRADFGDGGYSLIDQNAPDTSSVTSYHTYFNQTNNVIGSARLLNAGCLTAPEPASGKWSFHGIYGGSLDTTTVYCDGTMDTFNGIVLTDNVQFYAPQALGPGNPNTWYFGTDKLYRSIDQANTATAQTGFLGDFVNDIAISPQTDNVRLLGTNGSDGSGFGSVWATTTGGTMKRVVGTGATNGPGRLNAAAVDRVAVDPNDQNVGYVAFGGYGSPPGTASHLWRTSNLDQLNSATGIVSFAAVSNGLPDVPIDSIAIDPQSGSSTNASTDIYVGTDIGVYRSTNGGATWSAFNTGFPRVPVFGLAIQNNNRILRAATHGRGWYDISVTASAPAGPAVVNASSRITHGGAGTFDVNMPLAGGGVEPRTPVSAPGNFLIVVRFTNTLAASQGGATVVYTPGGGGTGSVNSISTSGKDLLVNLTNVSDVQTGSLSVSGVTDINALTQTGSVAIPLGFLIGDSSGDKTVNSSDVSQVKSTSGATVITTNFRTDVNHDGTLNSSDVSLAKSKSGNTIP